MRQTPHSSQAAGASDRQAEEYPGGVITIEVDEPAARKLFGQTISIHYFSETFTHTVGTVNGAYWFKVDVGTAPDDDDVEEEPQ